MLRARAAVSFRRVFPQRSGPKIHAIIFEKLSIGLPSYLGFQYKERQRRVWGFQKSFGLIGGWSKSRLGSSRSFLPKPWARSRGRKRMLLKRPLSQSQPHQALTACPTGRVRKSCQPLQRHRGRRRLRERRHRRRFANHG